jgi:hypothetical protein
MRKDYPIWAASGGEKRRHSCNATQFSRTTTQQAHHHQTSKNLPKIQSYTRQKGMYQCGVWRGGHGGDEEIPEPMGHISSGDQERIELEADQARNLRLVRATNN